MQALYSIYDQFLALFPGWMHPLVSIALAALIVYSVYKTLKRDFVFLIILIILLPASIPILLSVWHFLANFVLFLLAKR